MSRKEGHGDIDNQVMERLDAATGHARANTRAAAKNGGAPERWWKISSHRGAEYASGLSCRKNSRRLNGEIKELKAGVQSILNPCAELFQPSTSEMLAKHGIAEGPVDVRTLDAALAGLSLEQTDCGKEPAARAPGQLFRK